MDYSIAYNKNYKTKAELLTEQIKEALYKHKQSSRPFEKTFEKISDFLYESKKSNSEQILHQYFPKTYSLFRKRDQEYSEDTIKNIISNECFESFNNESLDIELDIDYSGFLVFVAEAEAYEHAITKLYIQKAFLKEIYDSGNLKHFNLEVKRNAQENSKENIELHKTILPEPIKVDPIKLDKSKKINKSEKEEFYTDAINDFDKKEKEFLIHVLYSFIKNKEKNEKFDKHFPSTEFVKILLITNGIEDLSIFYQKSNNCSTYSRINNGIEAIKKSKRRDFIINLIQKLEPFQVPIFIDELSLFKPKFS